MTNLPQEITNLVGQYQDEKTYINSFQSSNPILRNQTILNELQGVDIQQILQFKLESQLAKNYLNQNRKRNDTISDSNTLNGIFDMLLNQYSYDQLLTPKLLIVNLELESVGNIDDYIKHLLSLQRKFNTDELSNLELMKQELGQNLYNQTLKLLINNNFDEEDLGGFFQDAYKQMLKEHPEIPATISWKVNKELYIQTLSTYVPKYFKEYETVMRMKALNGIR